MKTIKEYALISIGTALVAIALEYFFIPNGVAAGGVSGLGLVIYSFTGIEPSIMVFLLNVLLFLGAFFVLGSSFGAKSIYSTVLLSGIMWIIERFIKPIGITDNLVLVSIYGSALLALGTTIVFMQNASTGGTTIIAKIINKYFNIGIGKGLLMADGTVTILAMASFGVEKGLFGFLSAVIIGNLVDKFINGINPVRQVFIITKKSDEMVEFINKDIDRGCTILDGTGGYTKGEVSMIYTVLNTNQFLKLKQYIKEKDSDAFVTVNESTEVVGKGF